ncbi:hypothetical protein MBLNU459_g4895t2 [Dothideomycetes sp. NU459]
MYDLWAVQRDNSTGLYHRTPLSDAQEYSLPGFLTGGPGGGPMQVWDDFGLTAQQGGENNYDIIWLGPETYRPNFNAYMIAGARAISTIANLNGQTSLGSTWKNYASTLYADMQDLLWSDEIQFWIDVVEGTNLRCQGRELIGYFPYRFDVGTGDKYVVGLEAGLTPEHFLSEYGPTTLEQTSPYFTALKNTTYDAFNTYVRTNYKAGAPYTAESHYPTIDMWSGDTTNHSENYLHSSYLDNVFVDLLGIQPTLDDQLQLSPLVPSNWTHFAVENLPYHGTLLTMIWDQSGSQYNFANHSAGLSIYSNGTLIHSQRDLNAVNVTLPFLSQQAATSLSAVPEYQNILANPNSPWGLPKVTANYIFSTNGDIAPYADWKMNDGLLWYDTTPDNRWTNNQSETPYNSINVTLPRARRMTSISLGIFDDTTRSGVIACPAGLRITTSNGTLLAERNPWTSCVPNALNTIAFAGPSSSSASNASTPATSYEVETDALIITLNNRQGYAVAVSEIQIWVPPTLGPRWEAEDGVIGTFIGSFEGRATGLNGSVVDGGVELGAGGWVELAGVRTPTGAAGNASLTVVGAQTGTVVVGVNWLTNYTIEFAGAAANKTLDVELLLGNNVVTFYQTSGTPWIDAITVQ